MDATFTRFRKGQRRRRKALSELCEAARCPGVEGCLEGEPSTEWDGSQRMSDRPRPGARRGLRWSKWLALNDRERTSSPRCPRGRHAPPLHGRGRRRGRPARVRRRRSVRSPLRRAAAPRWRPSRRRPLRPHDGRRQVAQDPTLPLMGVGDGTARRVRGRDAPLENANMVAVVHDGVSDTNVVGAVAVTENDTSVFRDAEAARQYLSAAMERDSMDGFVVVRSVVVHPLYRRRGVGAALECGPRRVPEARARRPRRAQRAVAPLLRGRGFRPAPRSPRARPPALGALRSRPKRSTRMAYGHSVVLGAATGACGRARRPRRRAPPSRPRASRSRPRRAHRTWNSSPRVRAARQRARTSSPSTRWTTPSSPPLSVRRPT